MLRTVLVRIAWSLFAILASTVIVFVILRALPGDPVLARLGASTQIDDETLQQLREQAGITGPLWQQYLTWIGNAARGDLGTSYFSQQPVTDLVAERVPITLELTFIAVVMMLVVSIPLAVAAAARPGGAIDRVVAASTSAGMSVPAFVYGIVLILVCSLWTGLLPARGYVAPDADLGENLLLMLLPALTLALVAAPQLTRFLRASMIELWTADFVRTARGKGDSRARVLLRHILPNALVPFLTRLGVIIGYTLGGVVVVEYMFGIPGLGSLALDAANKRDYAVLQGVVLVIVVLFILTTVITDIVHRLSDPRLRKESAHV
ncbi:ABC transporter permease [Microbacterium sp.]|uniref:ABC transporter permease n=1 Tax=Microbacterium sp. TaxID=51671 RepID=UPI0039E530DA